jgi:hypothetical protein
MTELPAGTVEVQLARLSEQVSAIKDSFQAERTASKEAITAAFEAAKDATAAALLAQKESAEKSEKNAQAQLEMHNGLIRKMDSLVTGFPTKDSVQKDLDTRDARLNALDRAMARAYGVAAGAVALAGVATYVAGNN